ncbi:hypothetical protein BpHYR1_023351 [Brachionus plicatilis]|uniref:Uncharacterized protein n=1 Tax=Brachionus plicatilis TaxID=10195 RepID=A0A3M7SK37_BRAPC|nr:hypothetical protein BpHYR1_023351 [Brachionus plicatilis]
MALSLSYLIEAQFFRAFSFRILYNKERELFEKKTRYINLDFKNYILDETAVRLGHQELFHLRLASNYPESLPSTNNFCLKVNVWGGISLKEATQFDLCEFSKVQHNELKLNMLHFIEFYSVAANILDFIGSL